MPSRVLLVPVMKKTIPLVLFILWSSALARSAESQPFGPEWTQLETAATGEWWNKEHTGRQAWLEMVKVPRDEIVAFALYTVDDATLKMSAQLYPLHPDEAREVMLQFKRDGAWQSAVTAGVYELGWSAHFRLENWDESESVPYRVVHPNGASFEGLIRANPRDKDEIVVASLSCNSSHDRGDRDSIVRNLIAQDPDLLFFAGDQSYDHREHTAAWLLWGKQFREVIRDRPTITIPDDHDIGQPNLWGEGGVKAEAVVGNGGGYFFPAKYVNMVERCQTWHLPDAFDPTSIARGIGVYYTSYNVGGVDFAIIEDRKFKSGPNGKIPKMGPRPDHINDPKYDRHAVDLPELELLGDRQIAFLHQWSQDWSDAEMKVVLSQTNFAGAVHLHGFEQDRLLADLDSNGWPQMGRNAALTEMRRAMAFHLAGDQHISVVTKHGIENWGDGPVSFVNPAIVNTIYGRWWWPEDEQPGPNSVEGSPLPWTGDYEDGFGNKISMLAYANPDTFISRQRERLPTDNFGDGYGLVRFNKQTRTATMECWPRFADATKVDSEQFPGWPLTFAMEDNDGRKAERYLPTLNFSGIKDPVVQVQQESTGEVLYTLRIDGTTYRPKVYAPGNYTVRVGTGRPDAKEYKGVAAVSTDSKAQMLITL